MSTPPPHPSPPIAVRRAAIARLPLAMIAMMASLLSACRVTDTLAWPDWSLARMRTQPRVDPYGASPDDPQRTAMRSPPADSVGRDDADPRAPLITGMDAGQWLEHPPLAVDDALLADGRTNFEAFCAACHGLLGDGESGVARRMELVRPRNLLDAPRRGYAVGRIVHVIDQGYGLMPSYAWQLDARQRWAVACYVKALQLSQGVTMTSLPASLQVQAAQALALAQPATMSSPSPTASGNAAGASAAGGTR